MTPTRAVPIEIIDVASKLSPQKINLSIISQSEHKFDEGYEINNNIGTFNDTLDIEGDQYFKENMFWDHVPLPFNNEVKTILYQELEQDAPQQLPELPPPFQVHIPIEDYLF